MSKRTYQYGIQIGLLIKTKFQISVSAFCIFSNIKCKEDKVTLEIGFPWKSFLYYNEALFKFLFNFIIHYIELQIVRNREEKDNFLYVIMIG